MLGPVPANLLKLFTLSMSLFADLRHESSTFCKTGAAERRENSFSTEIGEIWGFYIREIKCFLGSWDCSERGISQQENGCSEISANKAWFRC